MNAPVALPGIDPIDRLAVLAAALPGAAVRQRRIAASFEAVWRVIADLEDAVPRYEPGAAQVRVIERREPPRAALAKIDQELKIIERLATHDER